MNKKNSIWVLGEFLKIAHLHADSPALWDKSVYLQGCVAKLIPVRSGQGDVLFSAGEAVMFHVQLRRILNNLTDGKQDGVLMADTSLLLFALKPESSGLSPIIDTGKHGANGFLFAFILCLIVSETKGIGCCAACGKFFLKKSMHNKAYCNSTCRQVGFRLKKTPKKLKQDNEERRDTYRIVTGDKK